VAIPDFPIFLINFGKVKEGGEHENTGGKGGGGALPCRDYVSLRFREGKDAGLGKKRGGGANLSLNTRVAAIRREEDKVYLQKKREGEGF